MQADEMFKKLGYKMYEWNGWGFTYYTPKRRIHIMCDEPRGTVEENSYFVKPTKAEKEAIKQKIKEIKCTKQLYH